MTKEQIQEFTFRTTQANHSGLILVLTDVCKTYIKDSIECYKNDQKKEFMNNLNYALKAENELIACFNPSNAQSVEVISLLRYIYANLAKSQVKRCPYSMEQSISILERLRVAFVRLHEIDDEGPVMKNTHQVYAGLTYGKGTLNESVESANMSGRGFYA